MCIIKVNSWSHDMMKHKWLMCRRYYESVWSNQQTHVNLSLTTWRQIIKHDIMQKGERWSLTVYHVKLSLIGLDLKATELILLSNIM